MTGKRARRGHRLLPVTAALSFAAAALPFGASARASAGREDRALVADLRVFEIRRSNSDFSPIEGLAFPVASDGRSVQLAEWLATVARRVPEAYLAQLLTLGPFCVPSEGTVRETARSRGRRAVRVRIASGPPEENGARTLSVGFALLQGGEVVQRLRREAVPIEPGRTRFFSGRDFEIPVSRYLSWFREPGNREARGRLYRELRDHSVFLALALTLRREPRERSLPVRLRPPPDPRLRDLGPSLVGPGRGTVKLRARVNSEGGLRDIQVLETTFPEVTPRVIGITAGWSFPQAAGRRVLLSFPVTVAPRTTKPEGPPH